MYRHALTIGTFDTPHLGHAYLFRQCEQLADQVTIGVNSDEFVERYKGVQPLMDYEERSSIIRALGYQVVKNESAGRECIEVVQPDLLVIGSDWARKDYYAQIGVDQDFMDDLNISMLYVPRMTTLSSSLIKERVKRRKEQDDASIWNRHHYGA